jgi:hypothetical protein
MPTRTQVVETGIKERRELIARSVRTVILSVTSRAC